MVPFHFSGLYYHFTINRKLAAGVIQHYGLTEIAGEEVTRENRPVWSFGRNKNIGKATGNQVVVPVSGSEPIR